MVKINDETMFCFEGWMTKLKLKPIELHVYEIIYSYTKTGGYFFGSMEYLATLFNCTLPTINKALKCLVNAGYINKKLDSQAGYISKYNYVANMEVVNKLKETV